MKKAVALISTISLSLILLIGGLTLQAGASSKTLAPGEYDDLTTQDYCTYHVKGTWKDVNDYTWSTGDVFADSPSWGADWPELFGRFMGNVVPKTVVSTTSWAGAAFEYSVQPDTYVATALVIQTKNGGKGEYANRYMFEISKDGTTWEKTTAAITLDQDAGVKNYWSVYKAVTKIPAEYSHYRVTIPGTNPNATDGNSYTWPDRDTDIVDQLYGVGPSVASESDLSDYATLKTVPEFKTPELSAGVYDTRDTNYYYRYTVAGTWNNTDNYNWNNADGYAAAFEERAKWTGWDDYFGTFMGDSIQHTVFSKATWNGGGIKYQVQPGTYVATALPVETRTSLDTVDDNGNGQYADRYVVQISKDGTTWESADATITKDSDCGTGSFFTVYKAVTKIPEEYQYYRVLIPGFKYDAANGNEMTWANRDQDITDGKFGIGCSFASSYDLSLYNDITEVPDSPKFVDRKADLKAAINAADAINLGTKADGAEKDAFSDALEKAEEVRDKIGATQDEIDTAKAALVEAQGNLKPKAAPHEATVNNEDARLVLKPGVADWFEKISQVTVDGAAKTGTDGQHTWGAYYSDFAQIGIISHLENIYLAPFEKIHIASDYDASFIQDAAGTAFFGHPITAAVTNLIGWSGGYVQYSVYAGSYVSTAILVNKGETERDYGDYDWSNVQNKNVYQVSADGENWTAVTATVDDHAVHGNENYDVYNATVKIPDGKYFLRIVMPGALQLDADTGWYGQHPSFTHTMIGPSIASMTDPASYTTASEIPGYVGDYYGDITVTSKNTDKVQISDGFFKALEDMTVAQAQELVTVTNGSLKFLKADGTPIDDDTTPLAPHMQVEMLDAQGNSLYTGRGMDRLNVAAGTDLLTVPTVADITLENGAAKTVSGLKLPATVKIEAASGTFDATVNWDLAHANYDASLYTTQKFTVTGTIVLPDGVTNGSKLPLTLTVNVTVKATDRQDVESADPSKVRVDSANETMYVKKGMTAGELLKALKKVGDVTVVVADMNGDIPASAKVTEDYTVDVYSDSLVHSYTIVLVDKLTQSGTPGSTPGSTPSTGEGTALPAMVVLAAALSTGAAVASRKLRKK